MEITRQTIGLSTRAAVQTPTIPPEVEAPPAPRDRVSLGGPAARTEPRPDAGPPSRSGAALLSEMRPYIRDVYVVKAGGNGAPPILGGSGAGVSAPIPESLRGIPSHRWVCTPQIEAGHREYYGQFTNAQLRADDGHELEPLATPLLQRRYGGRQGMTVIELGPATSTVVPRALGDVDRYFATDLSVPLMERQRGLLNEPGYLVAAALQVRGDTYDLPYQDGIADVLFTSCHPPFVSSSPAERIQAFAEVARVLKPGGELVLFPFEKDKQHPEVVKFIDRTFEQVDAAQLRADRTMVVLRKRV